jgi:hypothetical protein
MKSAVIVGRVDEDVLLANYLIRVRRAARRLPRDRREWVIGRAGDRIALALDAADDTGQADGADVTPDVSAVLLRLGEPTELVQSLDGHVPGDEARWVEYLAVLLLVIGGLAYLPVWAGGAVLLWASPRWQLRERLTGTLIWPGGLAGFWFLATGTSLAPAFGLGWYSFGPASSAPLASLRSLEPNMLFWLVATVLGVIQAIVGIWLLRQARAPELRYPWESVTGSGAGIDRS